ncbi:sensor histidine kinase [Alteromonas lipolytica]|uniref:histidine kinase n=1 Tax=Alteromonas lipolytica TaxID=1856405 RepID=A0A1E8FCI5_9ALTE|nr:ATP-binding protein [Alteromonas lipolytica]OFI33630.1 histidine kinase [Alteromonas lipolytica]GGF69829.1 two-component sensor histidine kinase [Alteromonas lipolytica]
MNEPLLDKLPVGICLVNESYEIVYLNAFFLDRMPSDLREVALGKPLADVFPEQIKFLKRRIKSVFVLKHPSFSYWEQRPHIFPFKSSRPITGEETQMVQNMEIVPHKDSETQQQYACILIQDVTAQASYFKAQTQLAEQLKEEHEAQRKLIRKLDRAQSQLIQAEKMASTGQLAAGIAHEINNPMGFVTANLNTLEQYAQNLLETCEATKKLFASHAPERLEDLEALFEATHVELIEEDMGALLQESKDGLDRVSEIVSTLRSFAEEPQHAWSYLNLQETASQLVQLISTQFKKPKYKVSCQPEQLKWYCETASFKQALTNLMMNAAQSIEDSGLVMLDIKQTQSGVAIKIVDTGCGIKETNLKRVFEPFFTTRPEGKGQGLGLSVAYSAIEKHKGKLVINSREGKGTVIEVRLPRLQEDDDTTANESASTAPSESL